jgi:hypothetical protein
MPSLTSLTKIASLGTLPETRRAIGTAVRSGQVGHVIRRAATDRHALARDLLDPANTIDFVRGAVRHPATRELTSAGLLFMPGRYLPVGWAAAWAARRILRSHADPNEARPGRS